tara:strand:+ start:12101 stop:12550 length:450 start_codon:yes stop_codon:yes gene_type:complete
MDENLTVAELSKLAGPKTEAIMAGLQSIGKRAKNTVKGKKLVNAEKRLENLNALKSNKAFKVDTKNAEKSVAAAKSERIAQGAKAGAGLAAAGAAGVLLTKALKRGGKSVMSTSKKNKLIKAMKKNPKTTAAVAGGTGAVGLASLLKDK